MKCFQCKKEIENETKMTHMGDGDFVHDHCLNDYEKEKDEFFENIKNDGWYENWLNK